jgi:outer membrane protein OmpA-like peptidoglycan-associated protein/outer membrane protein assembly factor BamB
MGKTPGYLVAIMIMLASAPAFPAARENWPTYMGNQYLTGNNDGIIPEGEKVRWSFRTAGQLFNPVSVNNRVYVVSTDNYLYCLDAADGEPLWRFKSEGPLTRMVVVSEGFVYLPAGRFLYCLDEKTGEVVWGRRDPSFGFYGTPTVAKGRIFYGNRKGFYAREIANGHTVWENMSIYTYGGFPSYWNGLVYTVSKEFEYSNARLVALSEEFGTIRWSTEMTNAPNIFSPVVYGGRIYLPLGNQLMVFDAETGKKLWEKGFTDQAASHPVFSQGSIFLSLKDGTILRIDPESGEFSPLYKVPFGTQFAVVGSFLYIPVKVDRGALDVVDAESGRFVKRIAIGDREPSSLTIGQGLLYLPAGNTLLAIGKGEFLLSSAWLEGKTESGIGSAAVSATGSLEGSAASGSSAGAGRGQSAGAGSTQPGGEAAEKAPAVEKAPASGQPPLQAPAQLPAAEQAPPQAPDARAKAGSESEARLAQAAPLEQPPETATIHGTVKDRDTGKPLGGTVESTTELPDGSLVQGEAPIQGGAFEIEVPRKGKTDLIISSPGYTFKTISLPNEKAIDDLSLQSLEVSLPKAKKGETLTVESIYFRIESANLETESIPTLRKLLAMLTENPAIRIEIAGHTDSTGSKEFNMKLSRARAESVASWLVRNGVLSTRLSTIGYGDTKPVTGNDTPEGRRKNRRTEIRIVE